ncbi:MAG TPA: 50S ribosomal protein L1 [Actinomycetota bacterium]|nr:50S ribosomal protein L1 [Actinomycetota bacterium]
MAKVGKRLKAVHEQIDRDKIHSAPEAIEVIRKSASAKFDETVEVAFKLGIDPRKQDQMIRGTVALPAGTGKTVRVAVFAQGDKAREAEEAGADIIGADDLIERITGGWLEFDVAVATPDMMPKVGRIGKTLGTRGLMPNPKAGTVTVDVGKAIKDIKGGRVEYRTDKTGNVHLILGKASFESEALVRNFAAALEELIRAKPATAKGKYVKGITLSSTMGPGLKIDPNIAPKDVIGAKSGE